MDIIIEIEGERMDRLRRERLRRRACGTEPPAYGVRTKIARISMTHAIRNVWMGYPEEAIPLRAMGPI
jgi:hypothetical protein